MHGRGGLGCCRGSGLDLMNVELRGVQWPFDQRRATHADRQAFVRALPGSSELTRGGLR